MYRTAFSFAAPAAGHHELLLLLPLLLLLVLMGCALLLGFVERNEKQPARQAFVYRRVLTARPECKEQCTPPSTPPGGFCVKYRKSSLGGVSCHSSVRRCAADFFVLCSVCFCCMLCFSFLVFCRSEQGAPPLSRDAYICVCYLFVWLSIGSTMYTADVLRSMRYHHRSSSRRIQKALLCCSACRIMRWCRLEEGVFTSVDSASSVVCINIKRKCHVNFAGNVLCMLPFFGVIIRLRRLPAPPSSTL